VKIKRQSLGGKTATKYHLTDYHKKESTQTNGICWNLKSLVESSQRYKPQPYIFTGNPTGQYPQTSR
jgi:hypothetical protein